MENKTLMRRLLFGLILFATGAFGISAQIPGFQQPKQEVKEEAQPDVLVEIDSAAVKKPVPKRLVVDNAGVFDAFQQTNLEQVLLAFADSTSNAIMVVTVPDLEGKTAIEMAYEIGEKYGVGTKENNNGVVLLIKPKTRASRGDVAIAVGYGLEGAITDAACSQIIRHELIPQFKRGNYFQGAVNAVSVLMPLAAGEYHDGNYGRRNAGDDVPWYYSLIGLVLLILIFIVVTKDGSGGSNGSSGTRRGRAGGPVIFYTGGRSSFGGSSGGFGGFGGFGGGSFGGGGASGSW